jgi:hypothetical protein
MRKDPPGMVGLLGISVAALATCAFMTASSGTWLHWAPAILGIYVGWKTVIRHR